MCNHYTNAETTGPDIVGTFKLGDSISVYITDTAKHNTQSFLAKISSSHNIFDITWDPQDSGIYALKINNRQLKLSNTMTTDGLSSCNNSISATVKIISKSPTSWKLYQNYPNPYPTFMYP